MIYLFDLRYFDISNIILLIVMILIALFVVIIKKYKVINGVINSHLIIVRSVCVFLIVVFGIINLLSIGQRIYAVNIYNNNEYGVIEGKVEQLEYIYANNSTHIIGLKFCVKDKYFKINNGLLNVGYSINDNIINGNGKNFKIFYLDTENDYIDTILRIDK